MNGSAQPDAPLVSVVIVNYDGAGVLEPCLRSVYAQPYRPIEVILVDNASRDGSPETAERLFPEVRVIRNDVNRGFAPANNQGVAAASGATVVLLNNDTVVSENWIPGLSAMLSRPGVAAVTSLVITDGVPPEFYSMNGTLNYLGYNVMRHFTDPSMVFFAGGASMMFRREQVGRPFPDEYFLYHEDVFLSWRLRLLGYDVRMAQASAVEHRGSATTKRQPGRMVTFYQERNRLLNTLLMFERRTLLRLLPYLFADAVAKLALAAMGRGKSLRGIVDAYTWVATQQTWIREERAAIQSARKVGDREILRLMSPRVLDSSTPAARLLNELSTAYARLAGLIS